MNKILDARQVCQGCANILFCDIAHMICYTQTGGYYCANRVITDTQNTPKDINEITHHIPSTGTKETTPSGATRDNSVGKGRYDLIPPSSLFRMALRFEHGAEEHGDRNWENGLPMSKNIVSPTVRHLEKWLAGEDDEDHLAAAAWGIMAWMYNEEYHPEYNDVPTRKGKKVFYAYKKEAAK